MYAFVFSVSNTKYHIFSVAFSPSDLFSLLNAFKQWNRTNTLGSALWHIRAHIYGVLR
jgi:hypothetical protein